MYCSSRSHKLVFLVVFVVLQSQGHQGQEKPIHLEGQEDDGPATPFLGTSEDQHDLDPSSFSNLQGPPRPKSFKDGTLRTMGRSQVWAEAIRATGLGKTPGSSSSAGVVLSKECSRNFGNDMIAAWRNSSVEVVAPASVGRGRVVDAADSSLTCYRREHFESTGPNAERHLCVARGAELRSVPNALEQRPGRAQPLQVKFPGLKKSRINKKALARLVLTRASAWKQVDIHRKYSRIILRSFCFHHIIPRPAGPVHVGLRLTHQVFTPSQYFYLVQSEP